LREGTNAKSAIAPGRSLRDAIAVTEGDRVHAGRRIAEPQLQVLAAAHGRHRIEHDVARGEHGLGILEPVRRHALEPADEVHVALAEMHFRVDRQPRHALLRRQLREHAALQPLAQLGQPIAPHGETRGDGVAAVRLEQVRAAREQLVEIEPRQAAARAAAALALERDEHRRPLEPLDEPRRDDADDAGMPGLGPQQD
jgi:hypothetical protein